MRKVMLSPKTLTIEESLEVAGHTSPSFNEVIDPNSPFEISCLAKDHFFLFHEQCRRHTTPFARRCWSRAAIQPSTPKLKPPHRLAAAAAAHSRSPLRRSPRWPVAAPRATVRATGLPLLPTVCPLVGASSAIALSCWRLAKPLPVKPPTIIVVNTPSRLAAAARLRVPLRAGFLVRRRHRPRPPRCPHHSLQRRSFVGALISRHLNLSSSSLSPFMRVYVCCVIKTTPLLI
ncbi:hypothetical protein Syun_019356 [Stephania yunnanensis]|uniref:Uncharacterized protein n=1 Tax=Stephania yunnanensis TaxID=152371 RepID=A0AAP0IU16_9MAGN